MRACFTCAGVDVLLVVSCEVEVGGWAMRDNGCRNTSLVERGIVGERRCAGVKARLTPTAKVFTVHQSFANFISCEDKASHSHPDVHPHLPNLNHREAATRRSLNPGSSPSSIFDVFTHGPSSGRLAVGKNDGTCDNIPVEKATTTCDDESIDHAMLTS